MRYLGRGQVRAQYIPHVLVHLRLDKPQTNPGKYYLAKQRNICRATNKLYPLFNNVVFSK